MRRPSTLRGWGWPGRPPSFQPQLAAAACEAASGPQRALLVELFTSEGCSSCPPADRWLSGLAGAARRGDVVPLAFHVDYWDDLGWRDPYARRRFSRRQREAARARAERTVFTHPPGAADGRPFTTGVTRTRAGRAARAECAGLPPWTCPGTAGGRHGLGASQRPPAWRRPGGPVYLARWEFGTGKRRGRRREPGRSAAPRFRGARNGSGRYRWTATDRATGTPVARAAPPADGPPLAWSADGREVLQALALAAAACRGGVHPAEPASGRRRLPIRWHDRSLRALHCPTPHRCAGCG